MRFLPLLLLASCFGLMHELQAERVAKSMKPGCEKARAENAPDNGWLWRAEACGDFFGCAYVDGTMRCALWPNRPIVDRHLIKAADPAKTCKLLVGHPSGEHAWEVNVCGQMVLCSEVDGFFDCSPE